MDVRYAVKNSGWLYLILIPPLHIAYRLIFRKIFLHNRQVVKNNTPILIAANHPTAFVDPILFCIFFDPPVFNMTRGDIFQKPLFRKMLGSMNMFPVYRQRDGYEGRDRNDAVFEFCQNKMRLGATVNIFVEGQHHLDKRVLPIQKGLARIAFGTYERYRLDDLQVIPVGCNYNFGDRMRDEVRVVAGQPIFIRDYWAEYEASPMAAVNSLCREIIKRLKGVCYHINSPEDDALAAQLLEIWRSEERSKPVPVVEHNARCFFQEKTMLDRLNALPVEQKSSLRQQCAEYFSALKTAGLNDEGLVRPDHARPLWLLMLILTAPVALLGYFVGWPARKLFRYMAQRLVKKAEFYSSVMLGFATLLGPVYLVILLGIAWFADFEWLFPIAFLMPLLIWVSMFWRETLQRYGAARRANACPERSRLLDMRNELKAWLT